MLKKAKAKRVVKYFAGILVFFAGLFGAWSLYFALGLKPAIEKQLRSVVLHATDSLYRIEFKNLWMNCLTGNASLSDVRLVPDTVILKKLTLLKKAPNNVYQIRLKKLSVYHFHPFRIYREKKLNIDEIEVKQPSITLINKQFDFNEHKGPHPVKSPYDYISKLLKEVRVDQIDFKEASFKYIDHNRPRPTVDSVANLDVQILDWLIDPHSAADPARFYLVGDVKIGLGDYTYATSDSLYHINLKDLNFTASKGTLSIKKIALQPRYSEMDFGKVAGYAKDRFSIDLNNLNLTGINLPLYIKKQELFAKEMNMEDGSIAVFNNNELKKLGTPKLGQYPQQLLQKLSSKITIQSLNLNQLNISYAEFDRKSKQRGKITFENTSGKISNVTNSEKEKAKDHFMVAQLSSSLMGQGKLDARFSFDLTAADGAFSFSGLLHGMNGTAMNPVTKPLGMLRIKSGMVRELNFKVQGNEYGAKGDMDFKYNGLSVNVLKRDTASAFLVRQGLLSFLANHLILNPDNPGKTGLMRHAKIDYKRDLTRSFFNLIWKSLYQGIKYSIGITPEKQAQIKRQVEKFSKMKAERNKRRAMRQQRRSERIKNDQKKQDLD